MTDQNELIELTGRLQALTQKMAEEWEAEQRRRDPLVEECQALLDQLGKLLDELERKQA